MGAKRSRVKSSIDQLPPETRDMLEEMLSDAHNGLTYRDMADAVEKESGIRLSVSAIQRYAARYNRDAKQMLERTERMRQIARYMEGHSPADLSVYVSALIQDGLLRRLQEGQDEIDDLPIADVLKLGIQANRASAYVCRYRDQTLSREEITEGERDEDRMNWLRGLLRNQPELLDGIERAIQNEGSDAACGDTEMVCDSGADGRGSGVPAAAEGAGDERHCADTDPSGICAGRMA